jgi:hypothetical protein
MGFVDKKLKCDDCYEDLPLQRESKNSSLKRDLMNLKDANCAGRRGSLRNLKKVTRDID